MNAPRISGGAPRLEIVEATDEHAAEVAEFIRAVWNPSATAARRCVAVGGGALNTAEPGVPPPTWIALQAGRVLGYVTTIPVRFWDGERSWPAYWIKGLMVLPEYRNGPIGYAVMKAAIGRLPRFRAGWPSRCPPAGCSWRWVTPTSALCGTGFGPSRRAACCDGSTWQHWVSRACPDGLRERLSSPKRPARPVPWGFSAAP